MGPWPLEIFLLLLYNLVDNFILYITITFYKVSCIHVEMVFTVQTKVKFEKRLMVVKIEDVPLTLAFKTFF